MIQELVSAIESRGKDDALSPAAEGVVVYLRNGSALDQKVVEHRIVIENEPPQEWTSCQQQR